MKRGKRHPEKNMAFYLSRGPSEDESYDGKYAIFHRAGKRNTENA